jgi:ParB family chromosome partitioning protein
VPNARVRRIVDPAAAGGLAYDEQDERELAADIDRSRHPAGTAWLSIADVEETPEARNSRTYYDEARLNELAASIREHGVLQPIVVRSLEGGKCQVVFGNRRLKAAIRAGQERIPAIVKPDVDDEKMFLLNIVENIQRVDLSPAERVGWLRRLAASGYGVREISRATGLQPSTISRMARIARQPAVMDALEAGRIDIFRAMHLAPVRDEGRLAELIALAPGVDSKEFGALVRSSTSTTAYCEDDGRLADVDRKLGKVRVVTAVGAAHLRRIIEAATALLADYEAAARPDPEDPATARAQDPDGRGVLRYRNTPVDGSADRPASAAGTTADGPPSRARTGGRRRAARAAD